ncbi:MAG: type II toxin-antitoxin system HicB family antitoxin [Armatimonadetes bacterium]|nr:type II toxin-antitoxin system HicB family antitoxin [Armatimonadota bacterium]
MKARYTYWKEPDGRYLGFRNDYPDHWTQGDDLADLKEHLRDLLALFGAEDIPGIRRLSPTRGETPSSSWGIRLPR